MVCKLYTKQEIKVPTKKQDNNDDQFIVPLEYIRQEYERNQRERREIERERREIEREIEQNRQEIEQQIEQEIDRIVASLNNDNDNQNVPVIRIYVFNA